MRLGLLAKEWLVHMQGLPMVSTVPSRALPVPETTSRQTLPGLPLAAAFVLALVVLPAAAKTHPVPLEKNVDSAKCLECHEEKSKGKAVHSAIATGCLSCHEVRVNRDVTRVKLITTTQYGLCLTCHADKDATQAQGTVHPPAVRDCVKCHDPHTSDNKNQLLKATSGDKKDNLCLTCHTQGLDVPEKGSRHAALDMGCDTCHVTHKTGAEPTLENRFHLTKAAPALCLDCHDTKDAGLQKAHQNQPFDKADCLQCHDPHQSAAPKLMAKFLHPPFADKNCDTCHAPAKDGKVVLTQSNVKDLCVTCHDDKAKLIDTAKVQHPGAAGDCTDCHNPHAGKYPRFVRPDPVAVCEGCHSEEAEIHKTQKTLHQPAFKQGCSVCHEPHGGDHEHLLRVADTNHLCLTCHGTNAKGAKVADSSDVTIFDGAVRLSGDYLNQVYLLRLDDKGLGHPEEKHPVGGVLDPMDPQKVKLMTCLTCHTPHGGGLHLLVPVTDKSGSLCAQCHSKMQKPIVVGGQQRKPSKSKNKKKPPPPPQN